MNFIKPDDYTALVRNEIKGILLEKYSDSKLQTAEDMAISQVKNYLFGKYDTVKIFDATTERNNHIVMIVIDCTLYHLYTSTVPKQMPEIRSQRYQDAIDWLKMVGKGDALADLPKVTNAQGEVLGDIKFSSKNKPNNHKW
jgi:phage gp36-like protein